MLRALLRWLVGVSRRGRSDEDDQRDHAGSLLDASVNYAHGQADGRRAVREMEKVNEEASKLRDADDRRP
ncbi:hypothetical protein IL252_15060 [Halomicrobium sp. IBSBa]|uniref:hypothetical protein n=1 Tax=Halomicrobium sp. IBSBa TaxID=2778916 RepID=UPI001ABFBACB|nr:hypothetical protein [Halomicrobium sp. IBSBa]MBO4249137.1 hypothetical protein [Halomicrobium sp. IBSBa]